MNHVRYHEVLCGTTFKIISIAFNDSFDIPNEVILFWYFQELDLKVLNVFKIVKYGNV